MSTIDSPLNRPSSVRRPPSAVVVVLDQRLEALGHGLDLDALAHWLQEKTPPVAIRRLPDPGHRMEALGQVLRDTGAARLVLGLCSRRYALGGMQTQARLAGLDPLGVEVVDLGTHAARVHPRPEATEKARLLLAAAVARARAFPGSRPEMVKPSLPTSTSRRFTFALPRPEYLPVPWIERQRCAADSGCRLCAQACPRGALHAIEGTIRLDKSPCDGCGLCVAACPRDAMLFAGYAPAQLEASLATLLDPDLGSLAPRGILFACPHNAAALEPLAQTGRSYPTGWLPVQVPCVGTLTPAQLLGCLAAGAAAVAVLAPSGRCPPGQQETVAGRIDFCREFLRLLGHPEPPVLLAPTSAPELTRALDALPEHAGSAGLHPLSRNRERGPGGEGRPASALFLHLAQAHAAPVDLSLAHPHSPFGVVELAAGCTGCGVCAQVCPPRALVLQQRPDGVALTFDPTLCRACGLCLSRCTEAASQVLRLRHVTDLRRLAQGRISLYRDEVARCEACGRPVAPAAMLQRIAALLGESHAATTGLIARYCASCRAAGVFPDPERPPVASGPVGPAEP